jgi:hypothetical protein
MVTDRTADGGTELPTKFRRGSATKRRNDEGKWMNAAARTAAGTDAATGKAEALADATAGRGGRVLNELLT